MKRLISGILALSIFAFAGTASVSAAPKMSNAENKVQIVVGATPSPHAEILEAIKPELASRGIDLKIVVFTDYVQPNLALDGGELDANYFQHKPYLDDFNVNKRTNLVSAGSVHYEPLGIFAGKIKDINGLKKGSVIAVPNDTTNEARALLLLEAQGIIKIRKDAGLSATVFDITENPKKVVIKELEAAQLARSLRDVSLAVINGNYALDAGLNASTDAIAKEEKDSLAASTFANIIAVRSGDENREEIKILMEVLQSDFTRKFIEDTYKGAVVPVF